MKAGCLSFGSSMHVIFGWSNMASYTLTPSSLDAFGVGGLLAAIRQRERKAGDNLLRCKLTRVAFVAGIPIVAITLLSLAWPGDYAWVFTVGANLGLSLVFAWLIDRAADGFKGRVGRLLTWQPLLYTGKISYGLYVFHFIIAFSVFKRVLALPMLRGLKPAIQHQAVSIVVLLAMTFTAATLSWILYERPILKLKRFFPYIRD